MKVLIVFDSFFGNTEQVARAMGDALASQEEVEVLRVGDVQPGHLTGLDVLIVGSPTRAFSPSPATRKLVGSIPRQGLSGVKVAAFDTRFSVEDTNSRILRFLVKLFGYAAEPIANRLRKKGGEPVVAPEGFFVEDTEGPLTEGELERAAEWARQVVGTS